MNPFAGYSRISSPFGWRDSPTKPGTIEFHTGVDLIKPFRDPIYAFMCGTVVHAKEGVAGSGFGGYGIVVAVKELNSDRLHVYAHLDSAGVKVGQTVERGQEIGRLGTTGQSTGPHLHYEVRKTSAPSFGWIADRKHNCFEPTKYLQDLYVVEIAAKEEPKMSKQTKFPDVEAGRWSENVIKVVSELGIMKGYPDGTFKPGQPVTREEMAKVANDLIYMINQKK